MIITIDGLDGVGKSTLARQLAKDFDYEYVDKPIYELFNVKGDDNYLYKDICHIQKLIYDRTESNVLKSYFTGLSLLYIKECMSNKNIIIDRGIISAYAFNGDCCSIPIYEMLISLGVFFDASIILLASNEERIKRIRKRNRNDLDLLKNEVLNLNDNSIKEFLITHPKLPYYIINTNNKNSEQVLIEAKEYINSMIYKEKQKIKTKKI